MERNSGQEADERAADFRRTLVKLVVTFHDVTALRFNFLRRFVASLKQRVSHPDTKPSGIPLKETGRNVVRS